ncbi:MAG TPA: hypothetical protein VHE08_07745 [Solirubrobacterales bacterium]|nr:hypothetical protein [Solirubrobacterales bacterium]
MSAARGRSRSRDRELLTFVGRHGIVGLDQVMAAMGAGRTATYRRIAICVDLGLLERVRLLRDEPTVVRATRDGLDYVDLGLPVAAVSPGLVRHHLRCADLAIRLEQRFGSEGVKVLSEREFTWRERIEDRQIASVPVGRGRYRRQQMHRADLVVVKGKRIVPVEVELTAKAPRRLEVLIRAWRHAVALGQISAVNYYCAPGTARRAVERAVKKAGAGEVIWVGEAPA